MKGESPIKARVVVGIDGGQTSTRCIVCSADGACLSYVHASACGRIVDETEGPHAPGKMMDVVERALQQAGAEHDDVGCLWLGMTGVPSPESRPGVLWHDVLQREFPESRVRVECDIVSALHGAGGFEPGVVVLSGTGSIALGFNDDGRYARAGGWGWFLGDPGSGYAIGHGAIKAVTDSADGIGPDTGLTDAVLRELELECVEDIKVYLYTRRVPAGEIAALARLVSMRAQAGDGVAHGILVRAGADLAAIASAVLRRLGRLGKLTDVYPSGGVLSHDAVVRRSLQDELERCAPKARLAEPQMPPIAGSVLLAARECGIEVDTEFLGLLQCTLGRQCNERSRCME